jgi:hypothetical protein
MSNPLVAAAARSLASFRPLLLGAALVGLAQAGCAADLQGPAGSSARPCAVAAAGEASHGWATVPCPSRAPAVADEQEQRNEEARAAYLSRFGGGGHIR